MKKEDVAKHYTDVYMNMSEHDKGVVFVKFALHAMVYPKESYDILIPRIIEGVQSKKGIIQ